LKALCELVYFDKVILHNNASYGNGPPTVLLMLNGLQIRLE